MSQKQPPSWQDDVLLEQAKEENLQNQNILEGKKIEAKLRPIWEKMLSINESLDSQIRMSIGRAGLREGKWKQKFEFIGTLPTSDQPGRCLAYLDTISWHGREIGERRYIRILHGSLHGFNSGTSDNIYLSADYNFNIEVEENEVVIRHFWHEDIEGSKTRYGAAEKNEKIVHRRYKVSENTPSILLRNLVSRDRNMSDDLEVVREEAKGGDSNKKCFIATAVYRSEDAPQVIMLRQFRDEKLLSTRLGRICVGVYYKISPSIAGFLNSNAKPRFFVRKLLLHPVIWVITKRNRKL